MSLRVLAYVEDGNNARVVKASGSLRFVHEAQAEFLFLVRFLPPERDRFHRNQAIDLRVAGLIDHTHGSAPQLSDDLVAAKPRDLGILHGVFRSRA